VTTLAAALSLLLLAAQAPSTAPGKAKPPAGAKATRAAPAAEAAAKQLTFQPKTLVDGETLQVILGQRAVFHIADNGKPVIDKVEEGQLAAAHPDGVAKETFAAPDSGLLAAAVDGSAEKRATVLKLWNGTDKAVEYRAMALVLRKDKLTAVPVKVCAVAAGAVHTETWPAPIVAVGLARFKPAAAGTETCN
jgi:hypothetical protein